jgi:hypothetical protein
MDTTDAELNRLGGGIVPGSLILWHLELEKYAFTNLLKITLQTCMFLARKVRNK